MSTASESLAPPRVGTKRVHDPAEPSDGIRILVDRLWPRGLSRTDVRAAEWVRDVAPTAALRRWFGHDTARWEEFRRRYRAELGDNPEFHRLRRLVRQQRVTLLFAARDDQHNQARVLAEALAEGDA